MSAVKEDVIVEETALETEQPVVEESSEEVEYSDIELQAMEMGWNPEGVEGKRTLTAEEFIDRKPLYDKMHKLEKQIKQQSQAVEAIKQHSELARKQMHEDHLKELKAAKRAAMEDMDYEKVEQLDDEIDTAKEDYAKSTTVVPKESVEDVQATVEDWADKNPWYKTDKVMQRFAVGEGNDYRVANPDASLPEILKHIEESVKQQFPEKFQNMSRQKPSSVEGSATGAKRTPAAPKQKTIKDLPEEAIPVMKTLVRAGAFKSEQDYVNDYFNQ